MLLQPYAIDRVEDYPRRWSRVHAMCPSDWRVDRPNIIEGGAGAGLRGLLLRGRGDGVGESADLTVGGDKCGQSGSPGTRHLVVEASYE
jgi:hypothetical protein